MVIYTGFAYAVNRSSNAAYQKLAQTAREKTPTPLVSNRPRTAPAASIDKSTPADRLEKLLAIETAKGMIEVVDADLLRVANAFPSGSDQIKKEFVPMLAKIARELQNDTRLITVIGHTDNRPIFSARFPSNWHLSQARAKHVADQMIAAAPLNGRIRYEGHADSEPIVPNDTAANRARNRRIDIQFR
jgi:type VI secretion system protein ImpK